MKSPIVVLTCIAALTLACSDNNFLTAPEDPSESLGGGATVIVSNANNSGAGSLRAAIDKANQDDGVRRVQFLRGVATIFPQTPIHFYGTQDLEIVGQKSAIDGSGLGDDETNFLATGGGDLEISNLTFRNAPGNGVTIEIPTTALGTIKVILQSVKALDNLGHGIEINDQEDPDDAGNPDVTPQIRGNSNGSDASLDITVTDCLFDHNGFGALDRDGLRVNEGGIGDLFATISRTRGDDNGADGVELDERGTGSVVFNVVASHFARNGDFDQTVDDPSTPEIEVADKDDGMDVDEVDGGDLIAKVIGSTANDNFEEGWDFNENDAGDMRVDMFLAEASRNREEGIDLEEDDDFRVSGSMFATLRSVKANGNGSGGGDGGIKIRERADGDMNVKIEIAEASNNVSAGIHMREQDAGNVNTVIAFTRANDNGTFGILHREDDAGTLTVQDIFVAANENTGVGVAFDENADGNLSATLTLVTANGNGGNGVDADEASTGNLEAHVSYSSANGNTGHGMNFDENGGGDFNLAVANSNATGNTLFGIRADQALPGTAVFALSNTVLTGNTGGMTTGNVPPTP